ncbi:MAG TPA: hemolysin family protein [Anaerolineales bacterium]
MIDIGVLTAGFVIILVLDFITVASGTALQKTNMARLLAYSEAGDPGVQGAMRLLNSPARLQATIDLAQWIWRALQVLLLFIILYQGPWISPLAAAAGLTLLASLVIFWLEWYIRESTGKSAEAWTLRLYPFIAVLLAVFSPFVALPLAVSGGEQEQENGGSMVDELKSLVDAGQRDGLLEQEERRMLRSIFELGNTLAREIMVPRIDILALDVHTNLPDALDVLLNTGHTRVPVYQDTVDNILGLLYAKDLLRVWREGDTTGSLRNLLRPAYFVPEAKKVDELLAEMQSRRVHMAMVVDEYGGIAGLVTMEDIVEEIVGEIQDEYDLAEELPYNELSDGEYLFMGRVDLEDLNEVLGTHLTRDEADTLGGLIYSRLGRVPVSGESVQVDDLLLTIEQVSGRRIRKVRVQREAPSSPDNEEPMSHANG